MSQLEALIAARAAVVEGLRELRSEHFGARVFRDRTRAVKPAELPAVFVWTPSERAEVEEYESARNYLATAELLVEVGVAAQADAQDLADLAAAEVLRWFGLNETLRGTVSDVRYTGRRSQWDGEGDRQVVISALRFELDYRFAMPEHRDAFDLETIGVETVVGPEGTPVGTLELQVDQT